MKHYWTSRNSIHLQRICYVRRASTAGRSAAWETTMSSQCHTHTHTRTHARTHTHTTGAASQNSAQQLPFFLPSYQKIVEAAAFSHLFSSLATQPERAQRADSASTHEHTRGHDVSVWIARNALPNLKSFRFLFVVNSFTNISLR